MTAAVDVRALVRPDRVHHRVYTDPAVFELEIKRLFERTWIYAGHESELPKPGDYIRRPVGRRDIIVARTDSGGLAAFGNRCAHRGVALVGVARGHVRNFECPYHGWAYGRDGKLVGVPLAGGYPPDFDLEDRRWSLAAVAAVASYRGFIFVRVAGEGPPLATYLGPVADALDNMVDRAPGGRLIQAGGRFRQVYNGNWKLILENSLDLLHPPYVHRSSYPTAAAWEADNPGKPVDQLVQQIKANNISMRQWDELGVFGLPFGHAYMGGFYKDSKIGAERTDAPYLAYKAALIARHGSAKAEAILALDRFNTVIYPNVVLNVHFLQLRFAHPVAVDRTVLETYCFKMEGAPEAMHRASVRCLTALNAPSSMIAQDDHAVFAQTQRGVANVGADGWVDFSRGAGAEGADAGRRKGIGTSELPFRNQFQAWLGYLAAE